MAYLSINFSFLFSYRSNRLQSPINNNRSGKYSPSPFFLQYSRKRWALIEVCLDPRFLMWCDMHLWYYFQKQQYSTSTVIRGTKVRWRFLFSTTNSCRGWGSKKRNADKFLFDWFNPLSSHLFSTLSKR